MLYIQEACVCKAGTGNCELIIVIVYRKKHPLTFSFIYPRMMCGFKQKLQWIYPRKGSFWQCKN